MGLSTSVCCRGGMAMPRGGQRYEYGSMADPPSTGPDLDGLLRELLKQAGEIPVETNGNGTGDAEAKLLDVQVDGVRYILVRRQLRADSKIGLSPREREIVRLIARGLPNKAIAEILDVSLWTVATHLRRVFGKLGVSSRAEMVAKAL